MVEPVTPTCAGDLLATLLAEAAGATVIEPSSDNNADQDTECVGDKAVAAKAANKKRRRPTKRERAKKKEECGSSESSGSDSEDKPVDQVVHATTRRFRQRANRKSKHSTD